MCLPVNDRTRDNDRARGGMAGFVEHIPMESLGCDDGGSLWVLEADGRAKGVDSVRFGLGARGCRTRGENWEEICVLLAPCLLRPTRWEVRTRRGARQGA